MNRKRNGCIHVSLVAKLQLVYTTGACRHDNRHGHVTRVAIVEPEPGPASRSIQTPGTWTTVELAEYSTAPVVAVLANKSSKLLERNETSSSIEMTAARKLPPCASHRQLLLTSKQSEAVKGRGRLDCIYN